TSGRGPGGGPGGRVDPEPEPGRKAERPENAEIVLAKALGRLADRANDTGLQVGGPVERVAPLVAQGMIRNGVDGEIAPREIVLERDTTVRDDGVAAVGADVPAEGRDLVQHALSVEHTDGAVLEPHLDRSLPPE